VGSSPQLTGSGAPTGPRTPPTGPVEHHQRLITAPKPTATTKITSHDHAYNRLTAAGSDHTGPHRHPFNTSHLGVEVVTDPLGARVHLRGRAHKHRRHGLISSVDLPDTGGGCIAARHVHPHCPVPSHAQSDP